jgi:hypothetical protein
MNEKVNSAKGVMHMLWLFSYNVPNSLRIILMWQYLNEES